MIGTDLARTLADAGLPLQAATGHAARFAELLARLSGERSDRERWDAWFVPGRIEVLGKHTDYGGGRSLICAAERGFRVVTAPRADTRLVIRDIGRGATVTLDPALAAPDVSWATYPLTVLQRLSRNFPGMVLGVDVVLESDLPSAAGLSSSSALMIAVLLALVRANGLDNTAWWRETIGDRSEDLAAYAATIENGRAFRGLAGDGGVGTEGGSEDHTAILCSEPSRIAQYAFGPTRRERSLLLPPELVLAIGVSGVAARKTGEARANYNRASRLAARALERWRAETRRPDPSLAAALASSADAESRLRELLAGDGDQELLDRFEQFAEESTRLVPTAADQLERGDLDGFGRTVERSQDLGVRLLRNQVPETVALASIAREHGAMAASAFGAGFGGSVWALVEQSRARAFLDRWQNAYRTRCPAAAERSRFFTTRPGPAVVRLSDTREGPFSMDQEHPTHV
jgi:galactokinase